jgi:hypothetical protein
LRDFEIDFESETNMSDATADPALGTAAEWAQRYAADCEDVLRITNVCIETVNTVLQLRQAGADPSQHEIARNNFTDLAKSEAEKFGPFYRSFVDMCSKARETAANFLAAQRDTDPELVLMTCVNNEAYGQTAAAVHILRTNFPPTIEGFFEATQQCNAAVQADTLGYGDDGFQGYIYAPAAPTPSDEKTCPWCAETIKAAAIVCRYCNHDVQIQPNAIS